MARKTTQTATKSKPAAKAKKPPAKKLAAKPAAKVKAKAAPKKKPTLTVAAKAAAPPTEPTGLWKLLEQKEAQRKANEAAREGHHWNANRGGDSGKHRGFSRFAGPRRRAA